MSSLLSYLLKFLLQLMNQNVCFLCIFLFESLCLSFWFCNSVSISGFVFLSLFLSVSVSLLSLCLSVCVCIWRGDAHICVYACQGQGSMLGVVSLSSPKPYFLKQDLSLNLELINLLDWLAGEFTRLSRLCFLVLGLQVCFSTMFSFSMWTSRF